MSEKKKNLDAIIKKINKQFGEGTITTAAEAGDKLIVKRYPTPSVVINEVTGGGFCRVVELFGPEASGKTSLAIETIAHNQRLDPDFAAAWLETEHSVTKDILELHGVDLSRLAYVDQEDAGYAESALDIVRTVITAQAVDMVVVNSVAGLAPKVEIEKDLEEQNIALTARLMSKFFRVTTGPIGKSDMCVIFINQIRNAVGKMFGNPEVTGGGNALKYFASQRYRLNNIKIDNNDPVTPDRAVKISMMSYKDRYATRVDSNGKPINLKCEYYAYFDHGIDNIPLIPALLEKAGIMKRKGSWYYMYDETGEPAVINGMKMAFNGRNALTGALQANPWLREMLEDKLSGNTAIVDSMTEDEIADAELQNQKAEIAMAELVAQEEKEAGIDVVPIK